MLRAHLVAIMLAALAAACMGSSRNGLLPPRTTTASAATRLTVTYAIRQAFRSRDRATGTCVPGAHCFTEKWREISPRMWERMAKQTLTCFPDGGTYADPARACAALTNFYRLSHKNHAACSCPVPFVIGAVARGVDSHHRVTIGLKFCAACGLGPSAVRDIHVLTPRGLPG